MTLEHILKRIDRIADILILDAKQESTKQYARSIQSLTKLARTGADDDRAGQDTEDHGPRDSDK